MSARDSDEAKEPCMQGDEDAHDLTEVIREVGGPGEGGTVRISNDVLATITGIAASEIDGVAGMAGSFMDNISERLGRHDLGRGIKIETRGEEVTIEVFINVEYGCRIPDMARQLQRNVKETVENMTDLRVQAINVHIQDLMFDADEKKEEG